MRFSPLLVSLVLGFVLTGCARTLDAQPIGTAKPVAELADGFHNINQDGKLYFAGKPTKAGLDAMAARGVKVIVNIRTADRIETDEFDHEAYAKSLGMDYVWLPTTPDSLDDATVDRFAEVLASTTGPALLHCNSANTAGGLWAAYLAQKRGVPIDEAIAKGKAAGLSRDSMVEAVQRVVGVDSP